MASTNWTDDLFITRRMPLATTRTCRFCPHAEVVKAGRPGVGRGYGMREGNKARGRIIGHVREQHPEEYARARERKET